MSFYSSNNMKSTEFSFQRKYDSCIRKEEFPSETKSTCSDNYFKDYSFRQLKTLTKQPPSKFKDERISDGANIGRKFSRIRTAPSQVKVPLVDKTYKKFTVFRKQRVKMTKTANANLTESSSAYNANSHRCYSEMALPSNERVPSSCNVKQAKRCVERCNSLIDLSMAANNCCTVSPFSNSRESPLSISPSRTFNLRNEDPKNQEKSSDCLKEFDYSCKYGLFNCFDMNEYGTDIFSLAPNLEPPPKPITLNRKKYTYGILSADDSPNTEEDNKSIKGESKATASLEFQDNSDIYSTASSDCSNCHGDCKSLGVNAPKETLLIIDKPIRVKCIDEVTEQMTEIIIYTEEFLKNMLKECGDILSKKEVLENIACRSTNYNGKSVRILQEADFFIKSCNKSQSNFNFGAESKIPTKIPPNTSSAEFLKKCSLQGASRRSKSCDVLTATKKSSGLRQERKSPFSKPTVEGRQHVSKSGSLSGLSIPDSMKYNMSKRQQSKSEVASSKGDGGKKSAAAMKRIKAEEIIASDFRHYFHYYAMLGHSKCGVAISKRSSMLWLKKCAIVDDEPSERMAENCFTITAKTKCILNISDYIQFLILIAKNKGMFLIEVVEQLMSIHPQSVKKVNSSSKAGSSQEEANQSKKSTKDRAKQH